MTPLPTYRLIGQPKPGRSRGKTRKTFIQRFRLLNEKRVQSVSLQTRDMAVARRIAPSMVELKLAPKSPAVSVRTLAQHLDDFDADRLAMGSGGKHVTESRAVVERICAGCGFSKITDFEELAIRRWLDKQRNRKHRPLHDKSVCWYIGCAKAFTKWLARHHRLPTDLLSAMDGEPKGDIELTFKRRAATETEFDLLINNARQSTKTFRRLTPTMRVYLYTVAQYTGYRAAELASLTPQSFDLDGDPPKVMCDCTETKSGRYGRQVIPREIAEWLRPFLAGKPAGEKLWPGSWFHDAAEALRLDLGSDVEYENSSGRLDFHAAGRHTYITSLGESGAAERDIMAIGQLSSSSLVTRYCHLSDDHKQGVVERLRVPKHRLAENGGHTGGHTVGV